MQKQIRIICVGKVKDAFYRNRIEALCREIEKRQIRIEILELPDCRIPEHLSDDKKENFLIKECEKMTGRIRPNDYVIALCIEGKELTTRQHRQYVEKAWSEERDTITYVIGGSLGLPQHIKDRANLKLSFSKMTFPHQLMRMVLCEEIRNLCYL